MVGVGRDLCGSSSPTSCRSRVTYSRLHRTLSRRVLNISREGDSISTRLRRGCPSRGRQRKSSPSPWRRSICVMSAAGQGRHRSQHGGKTANFLSETWLQNKGWKPLAWRTRPSGTARQVANSPTTWRASSLLFHQLHLPPTYHHRLPSLQPANSYKPNIAT